MRFGKGGVDDAEDAEVIVHEYGHAIQDAQATPFGNFGFSAEVEWRFPIFSVAGRYTQGLTTLATAADGSAIRTGTFTGTGRIYLGKKKKA